jgi:hypothetical protein
MCGGEGLGPRSRRPSRGPQTHRSPLRPFRPEKTPTEQARTLLAVPQAGLVDIDRDQGKPDPSCERALRREARPDHRWLIEHCSLVNPEILRRIREMGVIPAPFYTYIYWHGDKFHEFGEERMRWMFAHRSFLDAGIPVAPASDYVPGPFEP